LRPKQSKITLLARWLLTIDYVYLQKNNPELSSNQITTNTKNLLSNRTTNWFGSNLTTMGYNKFTAVLG
jgi:hypothetical protein